MHQRQVVGRMCAAHTCTGEREVGLEEVGVRAVVFVETLQSSLALGDNRKNR